LLTFSRITLLAGLRFVHNESFGNKAVPRVALTVIARRGGELFSATRLRFAYAEGIKAPRFEESFGIGAFGVLPNPDLRPEENHSLEAGIEQSFVSGKYSASLAYYHNDFRDLIGFVFFPNGTSQNQNLNKSLAHGAEFEFHGRPRSDLRVDGGWVYTSTQVLIGNACDASTVLFNFGTCVGGPLLRRPRNAGSLLVTYLRKRFGGTAGGTFVGRRPDSDFTFGLIQPPIFHAAGYGRVDLGAWYAVTSRLTAYAALNNALDKSYNDVVGYPALGANVRAGVRVRVGGE
jgi:outer membrane receptor protein involved in Fe transport